MAADLLIVGDSHSAALFQGAERSGRAAAMLYISGNHWHENRMQPDSLLGLNASWRRGVAQRVAEFAAAQGGSVFPAGRPVLASFGYHLGRIAPLLARGGQEAGWSEAFLEDWLSQQRGRLWRCLRRGAKTADLVVVAPPLVTEDALSHRLAGLVTARLEASGLRVFDPRREGDWMAAPLPDALRAEDGVHATADYGAEVLKRISARGWLQRPGARG